MSFDFGSSDQASDPTADFLARERANAGALEGDADLFGGINGGPAGSMSAAMAGAGSGTADRDFERGASAFPALDGEDSAPTQAPVAYMQDDGDELLGGLGSSNAAAQPPANAARNEFEDKFPDLEEPEQDFEAHAPGTNGFMAAPVTSNMAPSSFAGQQSRAAPLGVQHDPYGLNNEEETEPIRRWREQQEQDIATREATAERRKAETVSKAEQDIDNFYAEYNSKKEKTIAANKEAEAKFAAQRQAELAEGTTWSRVTKLVDLQNSQSKTIARTGPGSSDLTRMKEVLLSLRREGETAPGAKGY